MSRSMAAIILTFSFAVFLFEDTNGASIRRIIHTDLAPSTTLPLSQAVQVNDIIYVSGQLGQTLDGVLLDGIENQTRLALEYMGHILRAANADFGSVVKTSVLLANVDDSAAMSEVYREFFPDNYPARAAYQVGNLPMGALVEIEAVAISGEIIEVTPGESILPVPVKA